MQFSPAAAFSIALLVVGVLGCMAANNRRAGWRRERSNDVLDVLMMWAQTRSLDQLRSNSSAQTEASTASQLAALHSALQAGAATVRPAAAGTPAAGKREEIHSATELATRQS